MTKEKSLGKSLVEDLACLKKNIAMGYVKSGSQKAGTKFKIVIQGRPTMGLSQKCHL